MKPLLQIVLLGVGGAAVGAAVVRFCPVLGAASSERSLALWAAAFTIPVFLAVFIGWLRLWKAGGSGGTRGLLVACIILVLPVFAAVDYAGTCRIEAERERVLQETGLDKQVAGYAALPRVPDPLGGADGGDGLIRGKVAVIEPTGVAVHPLHFRLPPKLRPASAADVGTVAHVQRFRDEENRWRLQLRLIDLATGEVVCNQTIPREDEAAEALKWLASLPQVEAAPTTQPQMPGAR